MENDRYARYGAASGVIGAILLVVGFGIGFSNVPDLDAGADEWLGFVGGHQGQIQFGATLAALAMFFLIWFLGTLRSALRVAEGGSGRLSTIAFGGGLVATAMLGVTATAMEAAAFRTDANADVVRGLFDLATVSGAPAFGGITALMAATAIVGYRYRPFPAPVAGFAALAAITQPLALGSGVADSGAWSGEGVLGLYLPVLTFTVAMIAVSVSLYRRMPAIATTAAGA